MGMFLACLFGGWFGLHKFMEKKIGIGILYLLSCGVCGIGWIIDCIIYGSKLLKNSSTQKATPQPVETKKPELVQVSTPQPITSTKKTETHKVTGMSNYMDNIMNLASENLHYQYTKRELIDEDIVNERVYEYEFYPFKTELIPEPDNPYDPNAVKVIVDCEHVGYIKKGSCSHILKLLREDRIEKIETEIKGGKYKIVLYDEYEDTYEMEKDEAPFSVHLSITVK